MLLGSSRNGRLEVTQFSVPTTSGTASVIWRNALCNTSGLTAPGSLNTCPNVRRTEVDLYNIIVAHTTSQSEKLGIFRVKSLLSAFCQFEPAETGSANSMIDSPSLFQLRHPIYTAILIMTEEISCKTAK